MSIILKGRKLTISQDSSPERITISSGLPSAAGAFRSSKSLRTSTSTQNIKNQRRAKSVSIPQIMRTYNVKQDGQDNGSLKSPLKYPKAIAATSNESISRKQHVKVEFKRPGDSVNKKLNSLEDFHEQKKTAKEKEEKRNQFLKLRAKLLYFNEIAQRRMENSWTQSTNKV